MDTLLQFYFLVGLVWATFWTVELTASGLQRLAVSVQKQARQDPLK